jgi:hypothetical protein
MSASTASHVRLTPSNAKHYIGCDIVFNSRGTNITTKLLKVSDTGKTVYIDHDDLGGNLVIDKRIVNVVIPKKVICPKPTICYEPVADTITTLKEKGDRILALETRVKELEATIERHKIDDRIGNLPEFIHDSE